MLTLADTIYMIPESSSTIFCPLKGRCCVFLNLCNLSHAFQVHKYNRNCVYWWSEASFTLMSCSIVSRVLSHTQ